jgi:FlaA1/EpsC-like NDP-sugar epimerase
LIPEAVHLVLQAAVLARDHDTFVLDMGEQIKVLDIARTLIRLSGFIPDEEIAITFTGLRPGEKLTEELEADDETMEYTETSKIFRVVSSGAVDSVSFVERINELTRTAQQNRKDDVIRCLQELVPTFSSVGTPAPPSVVVPGRRVPAGPPVVRVASLSSATRAV